MYSEKDLIAFGNFVMSDDFLYLSAIAHGFGPCSLDQIGRDDVLLMPDEYFDSEEGEYTEYDLIRFAQYMRSDERATRIAAFVNDDDADFLPEELSAAFGIHLCQVSDADVENFKAIYRVNA